MVIIDCSYDGSANIDDVYNWGSSVDGHDDESGTMVVIAVMVVGGGYM